MLFFDVSVASAFGNKLKSTCLQCIHSVYTKSTTIGSPARMHELLTEAARRTPVMGNYRGSYLTFRSRPGAIFAVQVNFMTTRDFRS
jgi:Na+/proline symporter